MSSARGLPTNPRSLRDYDRRQSPASPMSLPQNPRANHLRTRDLSPTQSEGLPERPGRRQREYDPPPSTRSTSQTRPGDLPGRRRAPLGAMPTSVDYARAAPIPRSSSEYTDRGALYDDSRPGSTASSSGSSFLDRMKLRSTAASSRTSIEEEPQPPKPSLRTRRLNDVRPASISEPANADDGAGSSLWARMISAAGSLTVNVGKAWESNIATLDGEETPPGQETRLTRAMKAYYLKKARDRSDLPPWLFDNQERQAQRSDAGRQRVEEDVERDRPRPAPSGRGLRDIYDAASSKPIAAPPTRAYDDDDGRGESRATARLRALREAKRSAITGGREMDQARRAQQDQDVDLSPRPPARRIIGLPTGPRQS